MAGASDIHNTIAMNVSNALFNYIKANQLPCKPYMSDMKLKTARRVFYPDIMVVCNNQDNEDNYYKTSPKLIIEVLSKSTRKTDKTLKRLCYQNIPSLEEYAIIEQDICEIEIFRKKDNWQSTYYYLGDDIVFDSLQLTVAVVDLYYQVNNEDMRYYLEHGLIMQTEDATNEENV
jgi:Uma2 family endonuclease